jgi:hypothetical protein
MDTVSTFGPPQDEVDAEYEELCGLGYAHDSGPRLSDEELNERLLALAAA